LRQAERALVGGGWWYRNPLRGTPWQAIVLLSLGTALETIGLISLVSLLAISDESKWKILLGLGVGFIIIGYFFIRNRSNPKTKQRPPASITPNTHCQEVCNRPDSIGRKSFHIPNIPRRAFVSNNSPITHRIPPTNSPVRLFRLDISSPLHCQSNNRETYHISTTLGNPTSQLRLLYPIPVLPLKYGDKGYLLCSEKGDEKDG
jgi:hypothetical protein